MAKWRSHAVQWPTLSKSLGQLGSIEEDTYERSLHIPRPVVAPHFVKCQLTRGPLSNTGQKSHLALAEWLQNSPFTANNDHKISRLLEASDAAKLIQKKPESTNLKNGDPRCESCQSLLQLLLLVVGGGVVDLVPDLLHPLRDLVL